VDALDRAAALMSDAVTERDAAVKERDAARLEAHQARAKLRDAQRTIDRLNTAIQQLEQRTIAAEQVAEQSRRAMLDHAART